MLWRTIMWRSFKVHLWGTCATSRLPLSILTTSRFSGSYSLLISHTVFQTPNAEAQCHPLASSSSSPCLNHHGVWQWQVLMTNAHFWRPLCWWPCRAVSLVPLPSLTSSSPVPRAPPHLPHLSILPCSTAWAGSHRKNACTANSTRAIQEDNIVWAATMLFTQEGIFGCVSDPWMHIKIPRAQECIWSV